MKWVLLLIPLLLVSGCISLDGIFGSDVLNIQQTVLQSGKSDILLVRDAFIIPTPPLLPDQSVPLSFTLENQDTVKTAENVVIDLFNAPTFRDSVGNSLCNQVKCKPNLCSTTNACSLLAGEQKQINIDMTSPKESEIAGIKTDTSFDYKINYDSDGSLIYTIPAVNYDEVVKLQRANKKQTLQIAKSYGPGPMQIDVELLGAQYILAGQDAILLFKLHNDGSGTVKDSKIGCNQDNFKTVVSSPITGMAVGGYTGAVIAQGGTGPQTGSMCTTSDGKIGSCQFVSDCPGPIFSGYQSMPGYCTDPSSDYDIIQCCVPSQSSVTGTTPTQVTAQESCNRGGMIIKFPAGVNLPELKSDGTIENSLFTCQVDQTTGGHICVNKKNIDIFKDESRVSLRFRINIPKTQLGDAPFKSYTIQAYVYYVYELRNSVSVTINPFQNV
jgi:hypothetical protein